MIQMKWAELLHLKTNWLTQITGVVLSELKDLKIYSWTPKLIGSRNKILTSLSTKIEIRKWVCHLIMLLNQQSKACNHSCQLFEALLKVTLSLNHLR